MNPVQILIMPNRQSVKIFVLFTLILFFHLNAHAQNVQYEMKDSFISQNGVVLNYMEKNQGENAVVFLHGFGLSTYSWEIFFGDSLANSKFYFIDLKGFGFSDKPENSDYSINEQAKLIIEFLHIKNIKRVSLVGHSYGGMVCLAIMNEIVRKRTNGIDVKNIVLLDVPAHRDIKPKFIKVLNNDFAFNLIQKFTSRNLIAKRVLSATFFDYKKANEKYLDRYEFFFKMQGIENSMRLVARQIIPDNIDEIEGSFGLIQCPTLILWGAEDKLIPLEYGHLLNKQIPNSQLEIIEKCGHVPQEEMPELTKSIMMDFWEKYSD